VYCDGAWSEIIKKEEELLKIGNHTVIFKNSCIKIGCTTYYRDDVDNIIDFCERYVIQDLMIHDTKVSYQCILELRDKWEKQYPRL
jgi:hypothetical protein